jgi:hypothetical protein
MPRFHKLENCSVSDNAFFALKGQIQRTMERGPTDGMITPNSPKQSYKSLRNSKMYPRLGFRPLGQICHVSLKGFRRQVSSRHKKRIVIQIKKLSSPMDLQHRNIARGAPPMSIGGSEVMPCHDFIN